MTQLDGATDPTDEEEGSSETKQEEGEPTTVHAATEENPSPSGEVPAQSVATPTEEPGAAETDEIKVEDGPPEPIPTATTVAPVSYYSCHIVETRSTFVTGPYGVFSLQLYPIGRGMSNVLKYITGTYESHCPVVYAKRDLFCSM